MSLLDDPEVTVDAPDPTAAEDGPSTGVFRFIRTGDAEDPLTVTYTVSGTATPDDDYTALSGTVTFDVGEWVTHELVTPTDEGEVERDRVTRSCHRLPASAQLAVALGSRSR